MTNQILTVPPLYSVLVIEDEVDILNLMRLHLLREGYRVESATTGGQAHDKLSLKDQKHHLIVLDWMIPEISGLKLLKWIRTPGHFHQKTPVLFVTAKSGPRDIVHGLENGADDYLTKPFDLSVFKARVKNLIRRSSLLSALDPQTSHLILGDLKLDTDTHKVTLNQKPLPLTYSEFRLLEILLRNQGKALARKKMIAFIQGADINVTGRTIDTHIALLRKKLGEYGKKIETVRSVGYRISVL